jgi:hypothetical protein
MRSRLTIKIAVVVFFNPNVCKFRTLINFFSGTRSCCLNFEALCVALIEEMKLDPTVCVFGEDVGHYSLRWFLQGDKRFS